VLRDKDCISCLCNGYGLNPMMFVFNFIGLIDIWYHLIAKGSFTTFKAFLFVKDDPNWCNEYHWWNQFNVKMIISKYASIEIEWNAFERGWYQLYSRIYVISRYQGSITQTVLSIRIATIFMEIVHYSNQIPSLIANIQSW